MKKSTTTPATAVVRNDSNKAEYEARLPEITATEIGSTNVSGNKPIIMIDNGEKLFTIATKDKKALVAAGLTEDTLLRLKEAAGACRYAVSELKLAMEYTSKWRSESVRGFEMCDTIMHALLYALRDYPELIKLVRAMAKGNSNRTMVQKLQDFSTFGSAHKDLLAKIGFDMSLLAKAAGLSAYLGNLLGSTDNDTAAEARIIRDKSYVYLKNVIREVRACGQYVFRNDKQHLGKYTGRLLPKRLGRGKKEVTEVTEQSALAQAA